MSSTISHLCNLVPLMHSQEDKVVIFTYLLDLVVKEKDFPDYLKLILKQKLKEFGPYMEHPEKYITFLTV